MSSIKNKIHNKRIRNLQKCLSIEKVEGILITNLTNIKYLTGFESSSAQLIISEKGGTLITDFRYIEAARKNVSNLEIYQFGKKPKEEFRHLLTKYGIKRLGFESSNVTFNKYRQLANWIGEKRLFPRLNIVEKLRMLKDDAEIAIIRQSVRLSEKGFRHLKKIIEKGVTEKEIALELELFFKLNGADSNAFDIIVAFGENSAVPHHHTGKKKLSLNDILLIDFGAKLKGYSSDLTRTFISHRMTDKEKTVYSIVLEAQQKAIEKIRPGVSLAEIDKTARNVITKYGFGDAFGHSFGHGIGLDIHELPVVSLKSEFICKKGMVITAEPGIYLPGWGGVRIEDDVLVTDKGYEVLSTLGKKVQPW